MPSAHPSLPSYVPKIILQRLQQKPEPIREPTVDRYQAVALFLDISGFTMMTENLEAQAVRTGEGPEGLAQVVNDYFRLILQLLTSHGGDVVKFTGDGILALWTLPEQSGPTLPKLRDFAWLAVQCAREIQIGLRNYRTSDGATLASRIGVGVGEMSFVQLGGMFNRWEYLVAGELLPQVARCERLAGAGEVVISWQTQQLLGEQVTTTPIVTEDAPASPIFRVDKVQLITDFPTQPIPKLTPEILDALRALVPKAIHSRMDAGQADWLAELRRLTVLFINLPELKQNIHEMIDLAQTMMRNLQESVYQFEGSINKINVDDKGVTVVAGFGLPPLAHEDDAVRGVKAALAIRESFAHINARCSIGIATGTSFCGVIGSEQRREYSMLGSVMNRAARIMQAAATQQDQFPQSVLCDDATYRASIVSLEYEALPPMLMKGLADPVDVYRPVTSRLRRGGSARMHRLRKEPIVGRELERKQLQDLLRKLKETHQRGTLVLEGEAGIGKSRLIEELLQKADELQLYALYGSGDSIERDKPYHAWQPIFQELMLGPAQNVLDTEQIEHFDEWYPLLDVVLEQELTENAITSQMTGQVRADNTRTLLVNILQTAAEQIPFVLIVEDAHWLDSASWAVLMGVCERVDAAVIIATRPLSATPDEFDQILAFEATHHIVLGNLNHRAALEMIKRKLGVKNFPEQVARLIQRTAEGHPFYSEEIAYALRDTGILRVENGSCRLAPEAEGLTTLPFPDTVQGVITSRIDQLSPPEQLTLKIASVIGRIFPYPTLHDVYPIAKDKPVLRRHLDRLENLDITPLETPEPHLAYTFKHSITQEVSYNLIPFAQRHQLHKKVAEWLEVEYATEMDTHYAILAHHWSQADNATKSVHYYEKAGEQALARGAYIEAIRFLQNAVHWADKLSEPGRVDTVPISNTQFIPVTQLRRATWERQLGKAYLALGQLKKAEEHTLLALDMLERPMPEGNAALVGSLLVQIGRQILHRLWPPSYASYTERAQQALLESARAYSQLANIYFFNNDTLRIGFAIPRTLNLVERAGVTPELAEALANMGFLMGVIPIHRFAVGYLIQAQEVAEQLDDDHMAGYVNQINAIYTISVGGWNRTERFASTAIEIFEKIGDNRRWGENLSTLGNAKHFVGDFEGAVEVNQALIRLGTSTGDIQQQNWGLDGYALNLMRLNRMEEALDTLSQSELTLTHSTGLGDRFIHLSITALVNFHAGQMEKALEIGREALSLGQDFTTAYSSFHGFAGLAEVFTLAAIAGAVQPDEANQIVWACGRFARRVPIAKPRALLWRAALENHTGNPSKAQRLIQQAISEAVELKMPFEEGKGYAMLSQVMDDDDPSRLEHITKARAILAELNAHHELTQLSDK